MIAISGRITDEHGKMIETAKSANRLLGNHNMSDMVRYAIEQTFGPYYIADQYGQLVPIDEAIARAKRNE